MQHINNYRVEKHVRSQRVETRVTYKKVMKSGSGFVWRCDTDIDCVKFNSKYCPQMKVINFL